MSHIIGFQKTTQRQFWIICWKVINTVVWKSLIPLHRIPKCNHFWHQALGGLQRTRGDGTYLGREVLWLCLRVFQMWDQSIEYWIIFPSPLNLQLPIWNQEFSSWTRELVGSTNVKVKTANGPEFQHFGYTFKQTFLERQMSNITFKECQILVSKAGT